MSADYDSDFVDRILFGEKLCPTCEVRKPRNSEHYGKDAENDDGLHRECRECRSAEKRRNRQSQTDHERTRYQTDPEYRERRKATSRENKARRYATDPEFRERVKATKRASRTRCNARGSA